MKRARTLFLLAFAVLLGGAISVAQNPSAQAPQAGPGGPGRGRGPGGRGRGPRTMKVVLAWADTRNGIAQHDSTSHALSVIERLGYETGTYDLYPH